MAIEEPKTRIIPITIASRYEGFLILRQKRHGNNIDTVTPKSAPVNVMTYPKKGTVNTTMTVLMIKNVLMKQLTIDLLFYKGNLFSMAIVIGETARAYFVIGLMSVVYIAIFELVFLLGRFNVICDNKFFPYIEYPIVAIDPQVMVLSIKHTYKPV